jgi:hypothetical protein
VWEKDECLQCFCSADRKWVCFSTCRNVDSFRLSGRDISAAQFNNYLQWFKLSHGFVTDIKMVLFSRRLHYVSSVRAIVRGKYSRKTERFHQSIVRYFKQFGVTIEAEEVKKENNYIFRFFKFSIQSPLLPQTAYFGTIWKVVIVLGCIIVALVPASVAINRLVKDIREDLNAVNNNNNNNNNDP